MTFTQHVWKKPNTLVYLHLGAIFHTCLDFDTYVWEKAHMCEKSHTIICLQMFGIFHTCVGKATDMLISPWAIGEGGGANSLAAQCCGCIFQPYLYHCTWHAANPRSLLHQQQGKYYIKIISNIMSVSSVQFTDIICNVCHIFMPFFYLTFCDKFQTENVNTGICIGIYCK